MREFIRKATALVLCELLVFLPAVGAGSQQSSRPATPATTTPLRDYLQKPYLDLFELAPGLEFSSGEIASQRAALEGGRKMCVTRFKDHAKRYQQQLDAAQKGLKAQSAKLGDADRKQAHCNIQNLDLLGSEATVLANQAIPTAYDNLNAKLDVIQQWPALY